MKTSLLALICLSVLTGSLSLAADGKSAEQVVRDYAATWNSGDRDGFFATQQADIHKYLRDSVTAEFKLTTSGLESVKQKYLPLFAKASRVTVQIVSLTTLGEIVVTRDRVTNEAENYAANEMTMYQVRDSKIINIWYLGREVEQPPG